jgi:CheY-like chemotaxis protein
MVHGLCEQFGGKLMLKSRLGQGTTAELWLPVAKKGELPLRDQRGVPEKEDRKRSLVILAIDDDNLVLTNTVAMLEDLGHTALAASSGREALELLRSNVVDLVITDQAMPHMTGLQLAEEIKRDWPGIPIILATGFADLPPGAGIGFAKLGKPYTLSELASHVAQAQARISDNGRVLRFQGRGTS